MPCWIVFEVDWWGDIAVLYVLPKSGQMFSLF